MNSTTNKGKNCGNKSAEGKSAETKSYIVGHRPMNSTTNKLEELKHKFMFECGKHFFNTDWGEPDKNEMLEVWKWIEKVYLQARKDERERIRKLMEKALEGEKLSGNTLFKLNIILESK